MLCKWIIRLKFTFSFLKLKKKKYSISISLKQTSTDGFGDSSFYSGKTCYGGSAARRKKV